MHTQIIDFGMARDLLREDYYTSSGGMVPVKWTAPEVCFDICNNLCIANTCTCVYVLATGTAL